MQSNSEQIEGIFHFKGHNLYAIKVKSVNNKENPNQDG